MRDGDLYLETPRLALRQLTESDLPALKAILQDEQTMDAYEGAFDDAMTLTWLQRMLTRYREDGFGLWAVELRDPSKKSRGGAARDSGVMIGQCGLTRQHILGHDVIEVGYLFNREHWHRGYASEAAQACVTYAFEQLGVERVWAQVRDTNIASMNVAIRLGMTVRGRFTRHYRGVDMPHLAFALDQRPRQAAGSVM